MVSFWWVTLRNKCRKKKDKEMKMRQECTELIPASGIGVQNENNAEAN
jgi:hypothetical protein